MYSWKDRVTDKLTNLFSDSPSSPTNGSHKGRSPAKDGSYFSSVLSFIRSSSEPSSNRHDNHLKPVQSLPSRWNSKDVSWQHMPLDTCDEDEDEDDDEDESDPNEQSGARSSLREVSSAREENGDPSSAGSTSSSSEAFEDATEPNTPMRALIDLTIDSFFISPDLYHFFQSSLPNIVKGCRWVLLYSTLRHGISLRTLIRKSSDLSGPCLLGDKRG